MCNKKSKGEKSIALKYLKAKYGPNFLDRIDSKEKLLFVTELLAQEFALYIPKPDNYHIDKQYERIYIYYRHASLVVDIPRRAIYLNVSNHDLPTPYVEKPEKEE